MGSRLLITGLSIVDIRPDRADPMHFEAETRRTTRRARCLSGADERRDWTLYAQGMDIQLPYATVVQASSTSWRLRRRGAQSASSQIVKVRACQGLPSARRPISLGVAEPWRDANTRENML